jgi:type II secretion system protein I
MCRWTWGNNGLMANVKLYTMRYTMKYSKQNKGFVLVEILIALAVLSIVLISVISGVTSSVYVISGMKNYTSAMLIAKSNMNDFILKNMRGTDVKNEESRQYPGFYFTRATKRWEHPLLGPLPANITNIIISWKERGRTKKYKISFIYQAL